MAICMEMIWAIDCGYLHMFCECPLLLPYFFLTIKRACDKLSALWAVFALFICLFSKTLRRVFLFSRLLNKVLKMNPLFLNMRSFVNMS